MKLVFATGNKGKLREAREILGSSFEVISPADLGITDDVPETAMTLKENSILKAEALYGRCRIDCFADDTGLEVDALGGAPGVHAARYAADIARRDGLPVPPDHDFSANIDALLSELEKHPGEPRTARFRSGFGYDPVFIAGEYPGVSVAELPEDVKNAISHRGKALRLMARWLQERE